MDFIELKNSEGKSINVRFRQFKSSDVESFIDLIRDEYGDRYHKRDLYDPDYIIHQQESGKMITYVAEKSDGEIIGCLSLTRNLPRETSCGISSGIVLKKYRRYYIFRNFSKYIAAQVRKLPNISAIYCRLVLYHDITEKLMERLGLKPTGFVPQLIIAQNFQHSFSIDENLKHTLGFTIRKVSKHDAGRIYIAEEHREFAQEIYKSLKVKFELIHESQPLNGQTIWNFTNDSIQQNCMIEIDSAGEDLISKIESLHSQFNSDLQTFNIFLNMSDSKSVTAYQILKKLGYFFAGFKPLCSEREVMILHNPRKVSINFDLLTLTENFSKIRDYVKKCYEGRIIVE